MQMNYAKRIKCTWYDKNLFLLYPYLGSFGPYLSQVHLHAGGQIGEGINRTRNGRGLLF